ncbi:MAG: GspE/PulE family protein [Solirubrobacterales bacterium]
MILIFDIELDSSIIDIEAVNLLPEELCLKNCIMPFKTEGSRILIAATEKPNQNILDEIKFLTGREADFYKADKEQVISAISSCFSRSNTESALNSLKHEYNFRSEGEYKESESLMDSPVIRLTSSIIVRAVCSRASDIHLEPFKDHVKVRYRVDGMLREYINVPKKIYPLVCTRIKVMAGMNITEKRIPQDGKMNFTYNDSSYDFRISTLPVVYGEKIVIRILYSSREKIELNDLGFDIEGENFIRGILGNSHGIILVTGPTGSGKSTTLYSMINTLDKTRKNIVTIEDPVEFSLSGVNQVNVNNKTGLTFAEGLRSILRQDPDVIMIGEIRDEETAKIAVRAALTGHLVISTLHTNDSASSVLRLIDMGVPPYLVCDAMIGTIAQRLVRKICPYCKEEIKSDFYELKKSYRGAGCLKCSRTGYIGRTVIYEFSKMDEARKRIIQSSGDVQELRRYNIKSGMKTIQENCRELVKTGITTLEEYNRLTLCV